MLIVLSERGLMGSLGYWFLSEVAYRADLFVIDVFFFAFRSACVVNGCAIAILSLGDWMEPSEMGDSLPWTRSPSLAEVRDRLRKGSTLEGRGFSTVAC
ncbi:hypothetical protein SAMN05443244_0933 [Terriglobus roseus]|uniref:Uncharacterized protein n=1 Tax=Terriglobus roseus TaxID=392734 RepID=A0A1H4K0R8_9BACT|nr:hypothetical protein SAMN05443244_0933 [Terriglobus roseus]